MCVFRGKMNEKQKTKDCNCSIDKESKQKALWTTDFFKKLEIIIDWIVTEKDECLYQDS